jgi:hypothetical protein
MAAPIRTLPGSAIFSECGRYRYLLTRRLGERAGLHDEKRATFIMLNPSTADATHNDPTIRKCIGFAQRWQCDTLQVLNLFAVRATHPHEMKRAPDPIGPDNLHWFAQALSSNTTNAAGHVIICAWGVHGAFLGQDQVVLGWLKDLGVNTFTLGFTKEGHPRHPLYVRYSTHLIGV